MRKPKAKRKLLNIKKYLGKFVQVLEEHIAVVDVLSGQRHENLTRSTVEADTWSAIEGFRAARMSRNWDDVRPVA